MTGLISLLLGLIRLMEQISKFYQNKKQEKTDFDGVLSLKNYRKKLEKALAARRKARLANILSDAGPSFPDSLPDDGYRRD